MCKAKYRNWFQGTRNGKVERILLGIFQTLSRC